MKLKSLLLFFLIGLLGISCTFHNKVYQKREIIDRTAFEDSIQKPDIQLVDIRSAKEHDEEGNFPNARNIDFDSPEFYAMMDENFDKNKPLYLHCKGGIKSQQASDELLARGYKEIYQLKGGFDNWTEEMQAQKRAEMKKSRKKK